MATLATPFKRAVDFNNPNQVKVVFGSDGRALFFSRLPLPFARERGGLAVDDAWVAANPCYKHLGLYAYHSRLLEKFPSLLPGLPTNRSKNSSNSACLKPATTSWSE